MTKEELANMVKTVAEETALEYINDKNHGDFYAFPMNGKGGNAGLKVLIYSRDAIAHSVENKRIYNACGIVENVFKLLKLQADRLRAAFGSPVAVFDTEYSDYNSLEKDMVSGLRATTWEKVVNETLTNNGFAGGAFEWIGLRKGATVDSVNDLGVTIECKGLKGRLTKFIAE